MTYLLDTNVLSEAKRGTRQARGWLEAAAPHSIFLSVITLGEIAKGIVLRARRDQDGAAALAAWLGGLRHRHATRILPVSDEVALEWGRIAAGRTRGDADGLIAATAIVHRLVLVTRNVSDFEDLPVQIINPWDEPVP